ncbi:hypothetical protein FRACYDRAFT_251490 [Fragilariopsis cylindrus CCMP1102]|uniref:Uncharacterized protein n=1 Tax=Fragilariopsis cylindrus CCMP1102 TaxID=635003 RepID=A0A1E7EMM3_9STRA|nr:hypothetical protein FRACYDRAFT_251490 [Fragilariopsis cylindrus CCMP1102]|eukprot:OEU07188.1 hypothetical protein FRACYDRAFT_251490 [Fragilariopsis cylindrus CCMP1102]
MSGNITKRKGRRKAAKVPVTAVSQSETKKRGRPARDNRKPPPATAAPPPGASRQLLLSPPSLLSPACAVSVSSSLTSSSTPRRKVSPPTHTVTGNDHESSPSKFLCLEQEELKVDLASALEVSAENLVETLTSLLIKLNNNTAPSSPAVASVTAASPATVETALAPSAASPVIYSNYTRPSPPIEFDIDAFKVADRSDSAARKGKSRAVNNLVQTILGEHCSNHYSQQQLVLALHTASKDPRVRPFFKSAGLADVEDLAAMRFHHEQINRILITTNDSKKKGSANDDVRSYEQSLYSAMAESPISSNRTTTVPSIASRTRLFSGIPYITLTRCMSRAKAHRKNMRDNNGTVFGRVLKRLGRTKVTPELHAEFLRWLDNHHMVIQSPLASDTLLVPDGTTSGVKKRVNKILLQIPVRELHNDLIDADPLVGLAGARDCNGKILISDTKLRELLPPHLRMMSDRYKIMCGCEPCIQMINLQQSYNRFICYRIKDFKEIRDGFNPRTRRYMAADETLKKYQDKVQPQGEARFKTAKLAMVCCLCAPPDDRFQSLHQLDCVTGECTACPGFDRPPEELTMNNDISFHLYDVLPSCSIHNMLPKFPPVIDGVRLVQTKSCVQCDLLLEADPNYVRGGFYKRKYLTQKKCGFQEFFTDYYLPHLEKYTYHRFLKIILSKSNIEDVRFSRLQPGEVAGSRDYAERLLMKFHMEIQSEHFGQGRDLSIEGNDIKFYPVGETETTSHFYSFLKDSKIQNAATTDKHMDRLIKILKEKKVLSERLYETTDGCGAQYRSATALWFLSGLSIKHNIVIDRSFGAPGHGKGIVDGVNGTDKNLLIRYSARELKQAMDSIAEEDAVDDKKRFAAHSVNEIGKEFSLAEECARLLRIGRSGGSNREENRPREKIRGPSNTTSVSELKYKTVEFSKEAKQAGGTSNKRYHVYCCPELGTGRVALRRIPCACVPCDTTIRLPWQVGVKAPKQPRFATVKDCRYRKILGLRNEWDVVRLEVDHVKANIDDVDTAREEILVSLSSNIAATIEIGGYGAIVTNDEAARDGYWMVEWTSESYTCQETGRLVCDGFYLNEVPGGPQWWTPSGLPVTTPLVNIVMGDVKMDPIEEGRNVPSSSHVSRRQCLEKEALRVKRDSHDYIFDEIFRRETLEYETRAEEEEEDEDEEELEEESEAEAE